MKVENLLNGNFLFSDCPKLFTFEVVGNFECLIGNVTYAKSNFMLLKRSVRSKILEVPDYHGTTSKGNVHYKKTICTSN